ncbi:NAD(P)-binding protein [Phyllobacterium endophyticum]|uniref:Salicylate hydroxylase n=1 Tax=Phyllobacterium endophyticum TaxID=1149773 RepID=A0A2P7AWH7_9HYPH|nr:salicylate hydroxylase [Phyllobacterium endophyticum]TYR39233.1 NAD(P)-binding protein [Phyllobacterium endophyticum]
MRLCGQGRLKAALIDLKTERNRRIPNPDQIIIAGAGIAGLTLALALSAKGFQVQIFEQSATLAEIGAGLQLSPNATRLLGRLGVLDQLKNSYVEPQAICLHDGISGERLLHLPVGEQAQQRWGAPYIVCHRADLQNALLNKARSEPNIAIQLQSAVTQHNSDENGTLVRVQYHDRIEEHRGALLVGADGVWSNTRNATSDLDRARYTGTIAWRSSVAVDELPNDFAALMPGGTNVVAWTGANAHLVAYPIRSGQMINFVAVAPDRQSARRDTGAPETPSQDFIREFGNWHKGLQDAMRAGLPWTPWRLFEMPKCRFQIENRLVLVGDAAHAMTPYAAQGAAMAIEDACALAGTLGKDNATWQPALAAFAHNRNKRIAAVVRRGALNHLAYHAKGPIALARNIIMRNRPAEKFMSDLDWLYGYDAEAS